MHHEAAKFCNSRDRRAAKPPQRVQRHQFGSSLRYHGSITTVLPAPTISTSRPSYSHPNDPSSIVSQAYATMKLFLVATALLLPFSVSADGKKGSAPTEMAGKKGMSMLSMPPGPTDAEFEACPFQAACNGSPEGESMTIEENVPLLQECANACEAANYTQFQFTEETSGGNCVCFNVCSFAENFPSSTTTRVRESGRIRQV